MDFRMQFYSTMYLWLPRRSAKIVGWFLSPWFPSFEDLCGYVARLERTTEEPRISVMGGSHRPHPLDHYN